MNDLMIIRVAFRPMRMPQLTDFLMENVVANTNQAIAIPTMFGVITICKSNKSFDEVAAALNDKFPDHTFHVIDVTPAQFRQNQETPLWSVDKVLDAISEAGSIENLSGEALEQFNRLKETGAI